MEIEASWIPDAKSSSSARNISEVDPDDMLVPGGRGKPNKKNGRSGKGIESFGAGLEKGYREARDISESERKGRTQRRSSVRSGSKNVFRGT